ncbi:MAG: CRISPR-associated helicase Cas3' [bacterium]
MSAIPDYLAFRGKAQPDADSTLGWHPAAYHCLDVAACVDALFDARPGTLARAAALFRLPQADARRLVRTMVCLHDIGKFSESFFGQAEVLWPSCLGDFDDGHVRKPHTAAGYALWCSRLRDTLGHRLLRGDAHDLQPLVLAVFGHHGGPLAGALVDARTFFASKASVAAAELFATEAVQLLCDGPVIAPPAWEATAIRASWWLAGAVSIADWLGSNQRWFPYHSPTLGLEAYWDYARKQAALAVSEAGLASPPPASLKTFAELIHPTLRPSPLQDWAMHVPLSGDGELFVVEDVTGAGKTEAAHILVHRLMAGRAASGAYWAMPTQATANAMYERQHKLIAGLFENTGRSVSLVLSHGQARLHDKFRASVLDDCVSQSLAAASSGDELDGNAPSTIACAAFLADDRRASLLADVGAGTIDQALLGILPSRFNTVRLFGLAEKVLILDEVHAYDRYMQEEIKTLLQFHAALGGSAIILSATLPNEFRRSLIEAWRSGSRGSGTRTQDVSEDSSESRDGVEAPYPLATVVDGQDAMTETPLEAAPWSRRSVPVCLVHDENNLVHQIVAAAHRGEAVAWIRNTVDSCLEAAAELRAWDIEPMVFHARFAQCDRQAREQEVIAAFGPASEGTTRARVLVATQVIEQSLDLDFDMLISDLAPVDLIIQRAGRLWRHSRTGRRPPGSRCELTVLTPRFSEDPATNWLDGVLPKTKNVYDDVGLLWRTLRELSRPNAAIETPDGVRSLVERVYADDVVPASLSNAAEKADGKSRGEAATARMFVLRLSDGYCSDFYANWYSDVRIPTRLIDEQTVVRLARLNADGTISPWTEAEEIEWRAWALSEVRVSAGKIPRDAKVESKLQSAVDRVTRTWPEYERDLIIVPMTAEGGGWTGRIVTSKGELTLRYAAGEGLRL